MRLKGTTEEKFWARVAKSDGCWLWTGGVQSRGYGKLHVGDKQDLAHRYSIRLAGTEIPPGHMVDHICHNRKCVRPDHLRIVTNKQNIENRKGPNANSKTGMRGVWYEPRAGRYIAEVVHEGRKYYAGSHRTPEEAAEAARQLRLSLFTHSDTDRKAS